MAEGSPFLDGLFSGFAYLQVAGAPPVAFSKTLNLSSSFTATYNPATNAIDIALLGGGPSVPNTRTIFATSPIRIDGGASADLSANRTISILPATSSNDGSMSAADKAKLDTLSIVNIVGAAPIVVTGTTTRTVSIPNVSGVTAGAMTITLYNFLTNILTSTTPTTIVPNASADPGASTTFAARADHTHGIATAAAGPIQVGGSASEGVSTSFARADHRHSFAAPAAPTVIQPDASASAGSAPEAARADHTHGIVADPAGAIAIGDSAAEGTATSFARSDHRHSLAAPATPQSVGAANSAGVSTAPARADHVHAHASQKELGASTITGTTTTRYLAVGYNEGTASANPLDMPVVKPFKIDSLAMKARVGGTAGQTITATIRKNGAAVGAAALTTASDATSGTAVSFTAVSFAANDTWGLQIDKSGAIASSPTDIFWSVGITPP